jgi:transposase
MVELTKEQDLETLRQISLLLDREIHRLIAENRYLTTELARLRGLPNPEQLAFTATQSLEQTRAHIFAASAPAPVEPSRRPATPGHGPRPQPTLPIVEIRHELPPVERQCPACGRALMEMSGQVETSDRITTVKLTYQVEHHVRQKYRVRV